jgi:hypothetical protein
LPLSTKKVIDNVKPDCGSKKAAIMLKPIVKLVSFVFNLNCSAIMLEVTTVGIADSKMVILAIFPFIPSKSANPSVIAGARISLKHGNRHLGNQFFPAVEFQL